MIKQKHILGFISVQYKTRSYNGDRIISVIVRVLASSAVGSTTSNHSHSSTFFISGQ
jgi:hypothetical protein